MTNPFTLQWTITKKDHGKLLKQFLLEQNISKSALTDIKLHGGDILINGVHVTVRHRLQEKEHLQVIFPNEKVSSMLSIEHFPLNIIYEDDFLLVINKPANMNTIPSREHPTGSLVNGLMGYYETKRLKRAPHIITRLDRNTSGLVLIAKHRHIHHLLSKEQKEGRIKREYEAFVENRLEKEKGKIEAPIGRKQDSIIERAVMANGQYALTYYEVIKHYQNFTHVRIRPETGRTHQIRVHMNHLGHPLVGDDLYGGGTELLQRQALHCCKLQFKHPVDTNEVQFICPIADDMKMLLKQNQNKDVNQI